MIEITPEYLEEQGLSPTFQERFWAKVDVRGPDDCWPWMGSTRPCGKNWPRGHGMIQRREGVNSKIYAHRAVMILTQGPIPEGKQVNHICPGGPNPQCCNPKHLEYGDQFSNMQKMTADGHNHFSNNPFHGEKHGMCKCSDEMARQIASRLTGKYGEVAAISRELHVPYTIVWNIAHGKRRLSDGQPAAARHSYLSR